MTHAADRVSVSPQGEVFSLPAMADYDAEYARVQALAEAARAEGKEVVVVMVVGFVGAVMAAIVADSVGPDGKPSKFVIGCQRPSSRSFWKIPLLNRGVSPVKAEDPQVDLLIGRCVLDKKTLTASYNSQVIGQSALLQHLLMLEHGLADDVLLLVFPVLLGEGKCFFTGVPPRELRLVRTQTTPGGPAKANQRPALTV